MTTPGFIKADLETILALDSTTDLIDSSSNLLNDALAYSKAQQAWFAYDRSLTTGGFGLTGVNAVGRWKLAGGEALIQNIEATDATPANNTFDFDNIPQGYKHLILRGKLKQDAVLSGTELLVYAINGNTVDSDYFKSRLRISDGTIAGFEGADREIGHTAADNTTLGDPFAFGSFYMRIDFYSRNFNPIVICESIVRGTADRLDARYLYSEFEVNGPINRIQILADSSSTGFVQDSVIDLVGVG